MRLVEVVEVQDQVAFWRGVETEVSMWASPQMTRVMPVVEARQIFGHHVGAATQKAVR